MATLRAATGGGTTVNATGSNISIPAARLSGDLIVAIVTCDQNTGVAFTWPATPAFTQIYAKDIGTVFRQEARWRIASATEAATFRVTHNTNMTSHVTVVYETGTFATTAPEAATASGSGNPNPNPPNFAPSWGSAATTWMAVAGNDDGSSDYTATGSAPPSYSAIKKARGASTQGTGTAVADRTLTATGENPGTFTLAANETWIGATIAIRPTLATGGAATPGPTFDRYYRNMRAA